MQTKNFHRGDGAAGDAYILKPFFTFASLR